MKWSSSEDKCEQIILLLQRLKIVMEPRRNVGTLNVRGDYTVNGHLIWKTTAHIQKINLLHVSWNCSSLTFLFWKSFKMKGSIPFPQILRGLNEMSENIRDRLQPGLGTTVGSSWFLGAESCLPCTVLHRDQNAWHLQSDLHLWCHRSKPLLSQECLQTPTFMLTNRHVWFFLHNMSHLNIFFEHF